MRYHGRRKHRIDPFPHFCLDNVPLKNGYAYVPPQIVQKVYNIAMECCA